MKKNFFTVFRYSWLLLAVLAMPFASSGQNSTAIACNDLVQISLDDMCSGVTPDMFLEGTYELNSPLPTGPLLSINIGGNTYYSDPSAVTAEAVLDSPFSASGTSAVAVDWSEFAGAGPVKYTINRYDGGTNSCWGTAIFESNITPSLPDMMQYDYTFKTSAVCNGIGGSGDKNELSGTLVDGDPDIYIDPEWYGSAQPNGNAAFDLPAGPPVVASTFWYGDIHKIKAPVVDCTVPTMSKLCLKSSFQAGVINYDEIDWIDADGALMFLKVVGGKYVPDVAPALDADGCYIIEAGKEYTVLVYATDNDAIGSYTLTASTSCPAVGPETLVALPCDALPETDYYTPASGGIYDINNDGDKDIWTGGWMPYGYFVAYLGAEACGADYTVLPVNIEECGDICGYNPQTEEGGLRTIVKYEILLTKHGKTEVVELLRQGYVNYQPQEFTICEPKYAIDMACGSDYTPAGVYAQQYAAYIKAGYPAGPAHSLAHGDAYPHVCTGEYDYFQIDEKYKTHEYEIIGTKEEIVWTDFDGDGVQDVNEWEVITVVDKVIKEVEKTRKVWKSVPAIEEFKYCGFSVDHQDIVIDECGGYKVIRNWRLINWCNGGIEYLTNMGFSRFANDASEGSEVVSLSAPYLPGTGVIVNSHWNDGSWHTGTAGVYAYYNGEDYYPGDGNATQKILVGDFDGPSIELDYTEIKGNIQPWTCEVAIALPPAEVEDDCDPDPSVSYTVWGVGTVVNGVFYGAIPEGGYSVVTYHATDACGNKATVDLKITRYDATPPVPVCEDELVVSLTPDGGLTDGGIAKIPASAFDAGSHDAGCGPIAQIKVVRMEDYDAAIDALDGSDGIAGWANSCAPEVVVGYIEDEGDKFGNKEDDIEVEYAVWSDYVKFCCEDHGKELWVIMRVWDLHGNYNDCMVRVDVQNKIPATWTCPDDVYVSCLEYIEGDTYDAEPTITGLCTGLTLDFVDVSSINSCGIGDVERKWLIVETGQFICTQYIYVTGEEAFDPYTIKWPIHYTGEVYDGINKEINPATELCEENAAEVPMGPTLTCEDDEPDCEPTWDGAACGLVGVSMKQEIVFFDDDACVKIINRWTVVDWCLWEPNDGYNNENLDDENDTARDKFVACEDWCVTSGCHGNYYFRYTDVDVDGYYTFDQIIKVIDEEAPTLADCEDYMFSADADDCTGSFSITKTSDDIGNCPSADIDWTVTVVDEDGDAVADTKYASKASGEAMSAQGEDLVPGTYTVRWVAKDGCGNEAVCEEEIMIADKKAPTPYCIQSISTAVMAGTDPMVEIWAIDYDLGAVDNCSDSDALRFTFSNVAPEDDEDFDEDLRSSSMAFTCDDVTGGNLQLQVWVWDEGGNADYCYVEIRIDDNGHCTGDGSSALVAGNIETAYGDNVAEAEVMLNSVHPEYPAMRTTLNNGNYAFGGTPLTFDYEVTATRDGDYMNGVSTLDLVLIQQHILGLKQLDNPYKIIAADVNSDKSIGGTDLVELRQLILGITSELANNDSWRFVDAAQSFTDKANPWAFSEKLDVYALAQNTLGQDFLGVKIGDVNGNAQANSFVNTEVRSSGKLNLSIADATVKTGDIVSVDVTSDNFSEVFGYQFTMNHAGLTLESVEAGAIDVTDANIGVRENVLTMSWNNTEGVSTSDVLFTINFKAGSSAQLSEAISINSRVTVSEAYVGSELAKNDISLTFTNGENTVEASTFELYQNEPNPFNTQTRVSFVLPEGGKATFTVFDVTGKVVSKLNGQYTKGLNTVTLNKADLGAAAGLLYYQLESGEFTATKKMIVIE